MGKRSGLKVLQEPQERRCDRCGHVHVCYTRGEVQAFLALHGPRANCDGKG